MTAEEQLLGICLKIGSCEEIAGKLQKKDFSTDKLWCIYKEMVKMQEEYGHISPTVIGERIGDVGYVQRIAKEADEVPSLIPILLHKIKEFGWKKVVAKDLSVEKVASMTAQEVKEVLEKKIDTYPLSSVDSFKLGDFLREVCETIENIKEGAMLTGINTLDQLIGGLHKGKLYVLAGRPSQGKTAFAVNITLNVLFQDKKVLVYPFEGGPKNYTKRMLSRMCEIHNRKIWQGELSDSEWQSITDAVVTLSEKKLIFPTQLNTPYYIIEEQIDYYRPDLVIIDYLQLAPLTGIKEDTHNLRLGFLVQRLQRYAGKYDTCIFCLSQVTRKVEDLTPPIPTLAHLRDCGEIEQAGDVIMFLYNPSFYGRQEEDGEGVLLKIAKNRDGIAGKILRLKFIPEYYKMEDFHGKSKNGVYAGNERWS